jgi:hypothetical protein
MLTSAGHIREPRPLPVAARALLLASMLLLALSSSVHAALFGARTDFATGFRPNAVAIADLNADGRPDLAVTNFFSNSVSVLLGNGDGTFGAMTELGTTSGPRSVTIADLNADGPLDLVVTNSGSNTISVMLGNGDGTFGARTDFDVTGGPTSAAIADLNADGRLDLAVANRDAFTVSILLGNGDGTFAAKTDFFAGTSPYSLAIADLNADGRLDLAVANNGTGRVAVMLGNGDGTFAPKVDWFTSSFPYSVAIADINGDGRLDMAVPNSQVSIASVLFGNGDGTFGAQSTASTGSFPVSLAVADLNGDGPRDLAVANSGSNTVSVLLGYGNGTFQPKVDFGTGSAPVAVAIADLNADCRQDLVVVNSFSNNVSVLLNTSPTPQVTVAFDFTPEALNLASHGLWVTGYIQPVAPLAAADIDIASLRLNGSVPVDPEAPTALGDHDGDGITDLMVKFSRLAVEELGLSEGNNVPVTITGTFPCGSLIGTDYIRVLHAVVSSPVAGARLTAGTVTEVRWQTPAGVNVESMALLYSLDGGMTWNLIAHGQPNTGSYAWTVPSVPTEHGRLALVLVESAEVGGDVLEDAPVEGAVGLSETFSIETVVGVGQGPRELALSVRGPDRGANGRLSVEFALRDATPARLELADVAGRVLTARQVGTLGPGAHTLDLSPSGGLRSGIYFLRLTQGGDEVRARAAVLR